MRIVLIDDEAFALRLLERQLANLGFTDVRSYTRARHALDALDTFEAEIIFCDLQMPEMDGVELVRHLARVEYAGRLILVSGEDRQILKTVVELARAHRLDVAGSLQKPVTPDQLRDALDRQSPGKIAAADTKKGYAPDELASAIGTGQMIDYYQPKVDIGSGTVVGVEALARWQHPLDGVLCLHALQQAADALQVAVAATDDLDGLDGVVVVQDDLGQLGAGAHIGELERFAHIGNILSFYIWVFLLYYYFRFCASASIRAIWSSGVVQVPTGWGCMWFEP